jgi:hypothetical protein
MQAAAPKEGEGELFIASHQKLAVGICQTKYRNFRFGKPELPVFQKLAVVPPTVTFIQNRNFRLPKPELPVWADSLTLRASAAIVFSHLSLGFLEHFDF